MNVAVEVVEVPTTSNFLFFTMNLGSTWSASWYTMGCYGKDTLMATVTRARETYEHISWHMLASKAFGRMCGEVHQKH